MILRNTILRDIYLYSDEFCITKSSIHTQSWILKNGTPKLDMKSLRKKMVATIIRISEQNGPKLIFNFDRLANTKKFRIFLMELRQLHPNKKLAIFVFRLSTH